MTEWRKHTGAEMPAELAAAQLILCKVDDLKWRQVAASANWSHKNMEWQPMLTEDGRPYVSADGLEPWAEYVMKDDTGKALQTNETPNGRRMKYVKLPDGREGWEHFALATIYIEPAPQTCAKPGSVSDSVMRVWRE